jgi:hypothetical protein
MAQPKKSHLPDRKHAPKKTGKRLPRPEDPSELVTEQTEMSAGPKGSLLAEQPPKPKIVGDRFQAFYLKPYFQKDGKSGKLSVAMAFSVALEKEHRPLLPKIVAEKYHDVLKRGCAGMKLRQIPAQAVEIYLEPDSPNVYLELPAAKVTNAALALIQRKGEGAARKVIRFAFRLEIFIPKDAKSDPISYFAERNIQNDFWLKMEETNVKLFDDEEDEEGE